jgi:hypothetical protein
MRMRIFSKPMYCEAQSSLSMRKMKSLKNARCKKSQFFVMKNNLISLICALFVFGCTQENAALKAVVAGTNIVCDDGHYVLVTAKRNGNSLEGIKLTVTAPNGTETILIADKGAISKSEKPNCFKLKLYDGRTENGKTNETWQLAIFDLRPVNMSHQQNSKPNQN